MTVFLIDEFRADRQGFTKKPSLSSSSSSTVAVSSVAVAVAVADKYEKDRKVGEGTYAVVYVGTEKATGQLVAIKKIKLNTAASSTIGAVAAAGTGVGGGGGGGGAVAASLDMSAIREIKALQELKNHPNIIQVQHSTVQYITLHHTTSHCSAVRCGLT